MSTLIVVLPVDTPGAATPLEYVLSADGRTASSHAHAVATLLPAARETVALVPAQALSWHRVELPKGSLARGAAGTPRLRALLEGLLEDRLLDDPGAVHFALEAGARAQAPAWVASCDRAWLRSCLELLESARRPAARIVPELAPGAEQVQIMGSPDAPVLAYSGAQGVSVLPLAAPALDWAMAQTGAPADTPLLAEPALAHWAEQFGAPQVQLRSSAERWLQAGAGTWDLAQFDMASSDRRRAMQNTMRRATAVLRAPQWRAARWGLGLLVAAHLVGVNAWAWKESTALADKRAAVRGVLSGSFPAVRVVVDAPVQMARELELLRQSAGAYGQRDLEAMLGGLGAALAPGQTLQGIEFGNGEARVLGLPVNPEATATLNGRLRAHGLVAQTEGERLLLRPLPAAGATP
ncbi:type II secretion system protein GspL [Pseudorhodoferax sp.]|uniref:type II secretion system protein GspL n=1 Tax=Pseudorhodoferax sp. TaxID=1993553 RepID=UPI002DD6B430|nr:type II secretion system protein GspL [Pseudorhodoferax sp.]